MVESYPVQTNGQRLKDQLGKKVFREDVKDFKVLSLGFGRGDANWNQLVDVYSDWGSLDKGVMRLKRTGTGMLDTSLSSSCYS